MNATVNAFTVMKSSEKGKLKDKGALKSKAKEKSSKEGAEVAEVKTKDEEEAEKSSKKWHRVTVTAGREGRDSQSMVRTYMDGEPQMSSIKDFGSERYPMANKKGISTIAASSAVLPCQTE